MKWTPRLSLEWKVMASVAIVVILLGAMTIGFIQVSLSATLRAELSQRGIVVARELAARSVDLLLTYNDLELHAIVHSTQEANRSVRYAFITDARGRLVVHTFERGFPYDILTANPLEVGQPYSTKLLLTEEGSILDVAAPIYDGKAGVAHVGMSYAQVHEAVADTIRWLILGTSLVLAMGFILSDFLAQLLVRPIRELVDATRAVGSGNLKRRAAIRSRDEIGELGAAFNAMAQDLERSQEVTNQLFDEATERARQMATLNAVAAVVNESPDPDEVLSHALDRVLELLQLDAGGVLLWDDAVGGLTYRAYRGFSDRFVRGVAGLQPGEGIAGRVFATGEPISLDDIAADPRLTRGVVREEGYHCFVSVPVRCKGKVLGVMNLASHTRRGLPQNDLALVVAIGHQLGVALENMRLVGEAGKLEALRELDRMKSEFVARASHELRTPVTAIRGYVETLLRDDMPLDAELQRELFEDMDQLSDRLSRLVHDLLNVSRIDVGKLEIRRESVPLAVSLRRSVRRFRVQAREHTFRVRVPIDLPPALADPDRLDDVLDNLLSNAVKYSPGGGTIAVGVRAWEGERLPADPDGRDPAGGPGFLAVAVRDQGIGVPDAELGKLFQRFYQSGDGSRSRRFGVGLGLYLCKTYVEAMGGQIWAESQPGKGSTFTFTLPADRESRVEGRGTRGPNEAQVSGEPAIPAGGDVIPASSALISAPDPHTSTLDSRSSTLDSGG